MKYALLFLTLLAAQASQASEVDARELRAKAAAAAVVTAWSNTPIVGPLTEAVVERIRLMKEADAWRTDRPLWIHFTDKPNCAPCERAEKLHTDEGVIAASGEFACVLLCNCDPSLKERIAAYGVKTFPTDLFISADRQTAKRVEGCPKTAADYALRLQEMGKAMAAAE